MEKQSKISRKEASAVAKKVYNLLREEDEIIGHLTDFKVKWLVGFCQYLFEVEKCQIGVDLHSSPKRIFLVPLKRSKEGSYESFPKTTWQKLLKFKKVKTHENDLPGHVGLVNFIVRFEREMPNDRLDSSSRTE